MVKLTSFEFDCYIEYLKRRGYMILHLYTGRHLSRTVEIINHDYEMSGTIILDTCDVVMIEHISRVDLTIHWYQTTPIEERLRTSIWLKQFISTNVK